MVERAVDVSFTAYLGIVRSHDWEKFERQRSYDTTTRFWSMARLEPSHARRAQLRWPVLRADYSWHPPFAEAPGSAWKRLEAPNRSAGSRSSVKFVSAKSGAGIVDAFAELTENDPPPATVARQ
ncbi:hypothetical protein [Mesorhizobium sp.]|uniref:hypothetical protein n=1 Tax=Mesorhizobium sp. TaxID=1871066 RepID=UPI0011F52C66|nr:hypothetical protein [Mesorhizobium sp.]TIP11864.1 MAG: hypothetical protein E5X73_14850 [Mesorhizobium sp.]